jgi:hypothetical protein
MIVFLVHLYLSCHNVKELFHLYFIVVLRQIFLLEISFELPPWDLPLIDPELDPGTKMGLGRPKNQSAQNGFKMDMCVGIVDTNPTQLERAQTDVVCPRYHDLFIFPNMQNLMIVQSYSPYSVDVPTECTGRTTIQVMWQGALAC